MKSWKTSICGIAVAAFEFLAEVRPDLTWAHPAAVMVGSIGLVLAKDAGVTGGGI